jgi:hypothetical protein
MTDDTTTQIRRWRAQLQAVEFCRAYAADDLTAARAIYEHEQATGQLEDLISAIGSIAVSFAYLVEASDNSITAAALWDGLTARALLGVEGTAEIDWITNGHNEGN